MNAIAIRDTAWQNTQRIPNWVRGREIGLDQLNTHPKVAEYCVNQFNALVKQIAGDLSKYVYVEPGAGTGSFYDLLPKTRRIGIDVEKYRNEYIQTDFLTWQPPARKEHLTIGNPPFGYRGWLALAFLNKAADFSDYVGFILPMSFQSDGKGSPKHRVAGMTLLHSEQLPEDLFYSPSGQSIKVNTLWQVWGKGTSPIKPDLSLCNEYIELFTVDKRKERLCGMKKIDNCKIFLQRTFYTSPPTLVNDFSKVKYSCGYGIIIKKDERRVRKILSEVDWRQYSNLATHNCRHISMYHIKQALLDKLP